MQSKDSKNAIIAVVLSGIILFGWNYFFPPEVYTPVKTEQTKTVDKSMTEESSVDTDVNSVTSPKESIKVEKTVITLSNKNVSVDVNSNLAVTRFDSFNSDESLKDIFSVYENTLLLKRGDKLTEINVSFERQSDSSYSFNDPALGIEGKLKLNEKNFLEVSMSSVNSFQPQFNLVSEAQEADDGQKFNSFVLNTDSLDIIKVGEEDADLTEGKIQWFGLDFHYHLLSFIVDSNQLSKAEAKGNKFRYATLNSFNKFEYKVIFLKKNYDDLVAVGSNLVSSVDFGIWSIIAVPILRGLQYFYIVFKNYGLAIIMLTILIRLLTFPLQYKSFKSMKKMQVIQPELQKIKEKYKDNPQKVQQETMALFKKAGANPLGGCLPMLLQMPVFFAFYKVLFTSVELVNAPFYFWITDLSEKDPFYILPVLMGLAMFLNMKLTPSTSMDPAQQKVMMFMPIIFSLFMINLPSGLTLYILVSTIVGMLQQLFVYKRTA